MTLEQEIWGVVLWVEKHHGDAGPGFIAEQAGRLATTGDEEGISLWREVARRYEQLMATGTRSLQS